MVHAVCRMEVLHPALKESGERHATMTVLLIVLMARAVRRMEPVQRAKPNCGEITVNSLVL